MHRARSALRNAACVFGAGEADLFAYRPQQGRTGVDVDVIRTAIDIKSCHGSSLLRWRKICGWGWGKLAQALLVIARRKTSGVAGKSPVKKYQQKQIVMN